MKKWLYVVLATVMMFVMAGCGNTSNNKNTSKLQVVTSFNGMEELVKAVGGDKVDVSTIIPDGVEPHDFELKPDDIKQLAKAQVFVYNGFGMEPWVQDAIATAHNDKLIVVKATQGITPIHLEEDYEHHGEDHHHEDVDPHAWLSPVNAIQMVKNIAHGLSQADPVNKDYYESNGQKMINQLQQLVDDYRTKFNSAPSKDIFTGHAAFGYVCRDFDLHQQSVEDVYAAGEPNAAQLAKLVEYVKDHHITTIFAEEMASPKVSETLAKEVNAKVETIYTMESTEDGTSYMARMKENLQRLYDSVKG